MTKRHSLLAVLLGLGVFLSGVRAADISRPAHIGASSSTANDRNTAAAVPAANAAGVPALARPNAEARLNAAREAVAKVRSMQADANRFAQDHLLQAHRIEEKNTWNIAYPGSGAPLNVTSGVSNQGLLPDSGIPQADTTPGAAAGAFVLPGSWSGVGSLTQTGSSDSQHPLQSTTVTVTQSQQQAILNWRTFNLSPDTKLYFNQTAGDSDAGNWIAFNKISAVGSPSQIFGQIQAEGHVYVINPNGIIFGRTAQVNTHALVASSLPINDNLVARGLLNNPDTHFLFSGIALSAGSQTPAFTPLISESISASGAASTFKLSRAVGSNLTLSSPGTTFTSADFASTVVNNVTSVALTASGITKLAGEPLTVTYTPTADQYGNVTVQPGAQLVAPTSADHVGGRIALIGPNVSNAGTISTPDGQTILAAGLQVGMAAHSQNDPSLRGLDVFVGQADVTDPVTHKITYSAGVASNDRFVDTDGKVYYGLIDAPRADITITGKSVNQLGVIDSTTSVSLNGRVDLLADYNSIGAGSGRADTITFLPKSTGLVTLGAGSVTRILPADPEPNNPEHVVGSQLALPSIIDIRGQEIHLASSTTDPGAVVWAPGAVVPTGLDGAPNTYVDNLGRFLSAGVSLSAGDWVLVSGTFLNNSFVYLNSSPSKSQIYFDAGTLIDVSGLTDVLASVAENVVSVQLRGTELANEPLQRNGPLRGQTIQIDVRQYGNYNGQAWVGTPLADTSGYVGLVQRTVVELSANGGTVSLNAGSSVVMQKDALINVSGGSIDYQGGNVQTTKVVSGGHIYDIAQATPDRVYDGIFTGTTSTTNAKWGVTDTSSTQLVDTFQPGYLQGGNGGSIKIVAPAMALDGGFLGATVAGPRQRTILDSSLVSALSSANFAPSTIQAYVSPPTTSELWLTFQNQVQATNGVYYLQSPTAPNIMFQSGARLASFFPVAAFSLDSQGNPSDLPSKRGSLGAELDLSPDLVNLDGFGKLRIDNNDGNISVPSSGLDSSGKLTNIALTTSVGGSIRFGAANIDISGAISAPSGNLEFKVYEISPEDATARNLTAVAAPDPISTRGHFTLGATGALSVAGSVVDDRGSSTTANSLPLAINAGDAVTIGGSDSKFDAGILISAYSADLVTGSTIDASGGVVVNAAGKATFGKAGSIDLRGGQDPLISAIGQVSSVDSTLRGHLLLASTLTAYDGGSKGGSLSILAPLIQIGGAKLWNDAGSGQNTLKDTLWLNKQKADGSLLSADFFSHGGFSSFTLSGLGEPVSGSPGIYLPGFVIAPSIQVATKGSDGQTVKTTVQNVVAPSVQNWILSPSSSSSSPLVLTPNPNPLLVPTGLRPPVSLAFTAVGVSDPNSTGDPNPVRGDFVMFGGSAIRLDPNAQSSVSLSGGSSKSKIGGTATVLGSVTVPGGTINVTGSGSFVSVLDLVHEALPTVDLGPDSVLSTAGATAVTPNALRLHTGTVLKGGTINVSGNIVAEGALHDNSGAIVSPGSRLDVSGATDHLDLLAATVGANSTQATTVDDSLYISTRVDSDGGTISFTGSQELFVDSTLLGVAGGPTAAGGTLKVSSGRYYLPAVLASAKSPLDVSLFLTQHGPTLPSSFKKTGQGVIGNPVLTAVDSAGAPIPETGHFAADTFNTVTTKNGTVTQGGFDSLVLNGTVEFSGPVSLTAKGSLAIGSTGILIADTSVKNSTLNLEAPYIMLGKTFETPLESTDPNLKVGLTYNDGNTPLSAPPRYGTASLTAIGQLIDLGTLSTQQIGSVTLIAQNGNIRGNGTLDVAGDLTLSAAQIYPPTAVQFNIAAYDHMASDGTNVLGSVTLSTLGTSPFPWSAGGQLNIFASNITQGGVLRAPSGIINLGWNGTSAIPPVDPLINGTNSSFPVAQKLKLLSGSITSVSEIDPSTGLGVTIPYGLSLDGKTWIDPLGADITQTGVVLTSIAGSVTPAKTISLSALQIDDQAGSNVDIRGGGDLYAYRFVTGVNGTHDILDSQYVANKQSSFAIVPNYKADFAPFAPYDIRTNRSPTAASNLGTDQGYVFPIGFTLGDKIFLNGGGGLATGVYTLLPARYALLPGAYLVTPQSGIPAGTVARADGSSVVSGYRFNGLNGTRALQPIYSAFEVAPNPATVEKASTPPASVVRARAEYDDFFATGAASLFRQAAAASNSAVPRLPNDAGQLVFSAVSNLSIEGIVSASALDANSHGGLIDINSAGDILIAGPGTPDLTKYTDLTNPLVLDARELSSFGVESLLIGGFRTVDSTGTKVTVTADHVKVDNGISATNKVAAPLKGADVILVANSSLTLTASADVEQSGKLSGSADALTVQGTAAFTKTNDVITLTRGTSITFPSGNSGGTLSFTASGTITPLNGSPTTFTATPAAPFTVKSLAAGSTVALNSAGTITLVALGTAPVPVALGDGALLRVSSDPNAQTTRIAVISSQNPYLEVGAHALLKGGAGSLTLDSTNAALLDPTASFSGNTVNFGSNQLLLQLAGAPVDLSSLPQKSRYMALTPNALQQLQLGTTVLAFSSYSSLDIYNTGGASTFGNANLKTLSLHAGEIRGGSNSDSGSVTFTAQNILVDNSINGVVPGATWSHGSLEFRATNTLQIGKGELSIDGYADVVLTGSKGILLSNTGGLAAQNNLELSAPLITGATAADQTITAGTLLTVGAPAGNSTATVTGGLGAKLSLVGPGIKDNGQIILSSGSVTMHATSGNVTIAGTVDVSGTSQSFYDVTKYTNGGTISLTSDYGAVTVASGATLSVAAQPEGSNAGVLSVSAPHVKDPSKLTDVDGLFVLDGTLLGGSSKGTGGTFIFDVGSISLVDTGSGSGLIRSLKPLDDQLNAGGFTEARLIRVRKGDVVVDGSATAHKFDLSTDSGSITVVGTIDAHGATGGTIDLAASGSVVLSSGSKLNGAGDDFDAAGKGGSISLHAGSSTNGTAPVTSDVRNSSTGRFDPSVAVVDIRSGSTIDLSVGAASLAVASGSAYTLPLGTPGNDQISSSVSGTITSADGKTRQRLIANSPVAVAAGSTIVFDQGSNGTTGLLSFSGDGTGGAIPVTRPDGSTFELNVPTAAAAAANAALGKFTGTLHLRAPQTASATPDVPINPIDGQIVNPSSIVVEGYKIYTPIGGSLDSVEADINADGLVFASSANSKTIAGALARNWSTLPQDAGALLHISPGAEIVSSSTPSTLNISSPGAASTITAVMSGTTFVLPVTSDPTEFSILNTFTFNGPVTLTPIDAGSYTATFTLLPKAATSVVDTASLPVTSTTKITNATTTAISVKLFSSLAGNITTTTAGVVKVLSSFSANSSIPNFPVGSMLNFTDPGPGTLKFTPTTGSLALKVSDQLVSGVAVSIPATSAAISNVTLSARGGSVTFTNAGSIMTWLPSTHPSTSLVVQAPSAGSIRTGPAVALNNSAVSVPSSGFVDAPANTRVDVLGLAGGSIQISSPSALSSPNSVTLNSTQGGTIELDSGGTVTTTKGGVASIVTRVDPAVGISMSLTGNLTLNAAAAVTADVGGTITLPLASFSHDSGGVTLAPAGGTLAFERPVIANTLNISKLSASAVVQLITSSGTIPYKAGDTLPVVAVTGVKISGGSGFITTSSSVAMNVTVANTLLPATPTPVDSGSTISLASKGTLKTDISIGVTLTDSYVAGSQLTLKQSDSIILLNGADTINVSALSGAINVTGIGSLSMVSANQTRVTDTGSIPVNLAAAGTKALTTSAGVTIAGPSSINDLKLANAWDLSGFRYGPNIDPNKPGSGEPGILTVRAAGNLIFNYNVEATTKLVRIGSLSDGFALGNSTDVEQNLAQAALLPAGSRSWTFQLTAGADLAAAKVNQTTALSKLTANSGSVLIGQNSPSLPLPTASATNTRDTDISAFYQVIRTGTGDISVAAGRDVQFLDPLAALYTAGTQVPTLTNFDLPYLTFTTNPTVLGTGTSLALPYPAQYSFAGGNVTVVAGNDIHRYVGSTSGLLADSSKEMPTNWLYRRGAVGSDGSFISANSDAPSTIDSTSWWIDFDNFYADIGALGGGNVTLVAGKDIYNIDAAAPTNARTTKQTNGDTIAAHQVMYEYGGGNLTVRAGHDVNGGVYYVERGKAVVVAGNEIKTNADRAALIPANLNTLKVAGLTADSSTWLPTTFFLGKASLDVSARGALLLGPIANPFLLPQGINNSFKERTYFSTYALSDQVNVASLAGTINLRSDADGDAGSLLTWYQNVLLFDKNRSSFAAVNQPWLRLTENSLTPFSSMMALMPPSLRVTAFSGDINLVGKLTLSPAPSGTVDFVAAGNISGFLSSILTISTAAASKTNIYQYGTSTIDLSDADPNRIPTLVSPLTPSPLLNNEPTNLTILNSLNVLFNEAGSTQRVFGVLQTKQALHDSGLLHIADESPIHLYATDGDISGLTLYSGKFAKVTASEDLTDIALYIQNNRASDVTVVSAGRDIIAYDPNSSLRISARLAGSGLVGTTDANAPVPSTGAPTAGDIQISGPGTLEVFSGRNIDLGKPAKTKDGTSVGIDSIGNARNPGLPFAGADVVVGAGIGVDYSKLNFENFITEFLDPRTTDSSTGASQSAIYLPNLAALIGLKSTTDLTTIWSDFRRRPAEEQDNLALDIFYLVLRNAGRDHNNPDSLGFGNYNKGYAAISSLFPGPDATHPWAHKGDLSLSSREIRTNNGGNISLLVPGGQLSLGTDLNSTSLTPPGILTEHGGTISIFSNESVNVGVSRIFTLRGGDEVIWSTEGDIAAGRSSKTVKSAAPTQVLIDPQSANVHTNLAGLATGGGIGVLATVAGIPPGNVDLIAPAGTVDAGDAGIRATGNLNIAALHVVNASNIQASGLSTGLPPPPPPPNIAGLTSANTANNAANNAASDVAKHDANATQPTEMPSLITVEVLGYGSDDAQIEPSSGDIPPDPATDTTTKEKKKKKDPPK